MLARPTSRRTSTALAFGIVFLRHSARSTSVNPSTTYDERQRSGLMSAVQSR